MPRLLSTQEVAAALGITPRTVARRVAAGKLTPAQKLPGETGAYLFAPDATERLEDAGEPTAEIAS